jgi:hypothetical protein
MASSRGGCHWAAKPDRLQSVCSRLLAGSPERQIAPKAVVQFSRAGARLFHVAKPPTHVHSAELIAGNCNTLQPNHPSAD